MIDVHQVLSRRRNTSYAMEGLACAYRLAELGDDEVSARKLRAALQTGLLKLTSWQVGGPLPSAYLRAHPEYLADCRGGVLEADENPWLRIDITQHQMHAVILARRYVWQD